MTFDSKREYLKVSEMALRRQGIVRAYCARSDRYFHDYCSASNCRCSCHKRG